MKVTAREFEREIQKLIGRKNLQTGWDRNLGKCYWVFSKEEFSKIKEFVGYSNNNVRVINEQDPVVIVMRRANTWYC